MYLPTLFNMQGSDEHCKFFKWLDGIPCRRRAEIALIVIAKFTRLEAEAAMAKKKMRRKPMQWLQTYSTGKE